MPLVVVNSNAWVETKGIRAIRVIGFQVIITYESGEPIIVYCDTTKEALEAMYNLTSAVNRAQKEEDK